MNYLKPFQSYFPYFIEVAPATTPVTLEEVKEHLRLDDIDALQDDYLTLLIYAATNFCEKYTNRTLITTTFRSVRNHLSDAIELRRSPFQTLESFKYTVNETRVDIDSNLYYVYETPDFNKILLKDNFEYPMDGDDKLQGIQIIFKAGYGDVSDDIPKDLKLAILNHISSIYENRGDCDQASVMSALPNTSRSIYDFYKIVELHA